MSRKKLLIERTLQSLLKYGSFMIVIMVVVFACSNSAEEKTTLPEEPTGNLIVKIDGAIMGSVMAPNPELEITASNPEETIKATTNENGQFYITGFEKVTYTVIVKNENSSEQVVFEEVLVAVDEVTALNTIDLATL